MNSKSKKRLIANLPSGVSVSKHSVGNREMFRVVLGKRFTGGAKVDKHFAKLEDARDWLTEQIKHRSQLQAVSLTPEQLSEAKTAFSLLQPTGMSLSEAVAFALRHGRKENQRRFDDLVAEFLHSRENMKVKPTTLRNYRSQFHIMSEEFGKMNAGTISTRKIEDWLDDEEEWSPRTRRNYITTFHALLEYAVAREYCILNAAAKVAKPLLDDKPPGILTPSQTEALLNAALEYDVEMVAGIAVQLFAGVRRSEVCALEWSELAGDYIEITATKAKTRRRRLINANDALRAWLGAVERHSTNLTPSQRPDVYGERLSSLADRAGIVPWPHNALRHSFGTYHLAQFKNEGLTATLMGNTPNIVVAHYRKPVIEEDAKAFWSIRPSAPGADGIALPASVA